jgi:hypothetical protein
MAGFTDIESIYGVGYSAFQVNQKIQRDNKVLISILVRREISVDGMSFEDVPTYIVGKPMSETPCV